MALLCCGLVHWAITSTVILGSTSSALITGRLFALPKRGFARLVSKLTFTFTFTTFTFVITVGVLVGLLLLVGRVVVVVIVIVLTIPVIVIFVIVIVVNSLIIVRGERFTITTVLVSGSILIL
jgi:hypothetical protein